VSARAGEEIVVAGEDEGAWSVEAKEMGDSRMDHFPMLRLNDALTFKTSTIPKVSAASSSLWRRLASILHEIQRPCTGDKRELTSLQARVDQLELQNWASKDDDNSESDGYNLTNSALTDQKSPSKKAKHEK
jgi:hypothetical protein